MITWPEPHDKESKGHKEKSVHFKFLNKPKKPGSKFCKFVVLLLTDFMLHDALFEFY